MNDLPNLEKFIAIRMVKEFRSEALMSSSLATKFSSMADALESHYRIMAPPEKKNIEIKVERKPRKLYFFSGILVCLAMLYFFTKF